MHFTRTILNQEKKGDSACMMLRDYSWRLFEITGDINSYMLYKEAGKINKNNKNRTGEQQGTDINLKG